MDARRALLVLRRWWPLLVAGTPLPAPAAPAGHPSDASLLANAMATVFVARDAQLRTAGLTPALAAINRQIASYSADYAAAQRHINQLALQGGRQSPTQQVQSTALF